MRTSVILLLNNADVFKDKLSKVQLFITSRYNVFMSARYR